MLSDAQRILISAHAAGDVPGDKKPAVERLLAQSDDARSLFQALKADAAALRNLPRLPLPAGLHDAIVNRLPQPATVAAKKRHRLREWTAAFVVATAVFAVCAGTWWAYQISRDDRRVDEPLVRNGPATTDLMVGAKERQPAPPPNPAPPPAVVAAVPPPAATPTPELAGPAPPPIAERKELASPPKTNFEAIQVQPPRLPGAFAVRALDQGDVRPRFLAELSRGETHRMDLFCRDAGKGLERVAAVLRSRGVAVQADALVVEMLKRKVRGPYALYCEDLTPAEWAGLFKTIAAADRRYEDLKPGDGAFDQLVLMPLAPADQKDLSALLGVDPLAPPPKPKPADPKRPGESATEPAAPSAAKGKSAIAVPAPPVRFSPGASKEIKQFFDNRRERAAGTVAVILYFRLPA